MAIGVATVQGELRSRVQSGAYGVETQSGTAEVEVPLRELYGIIKNRWQTIEAQAGLLHALYYYHPTQKDLSRRKHEAVYLKILFQDDEEMDGGHSRIDSAFAHVATAPA